MEFLLIGFGLCIGFFGLAGIGEYIFIKFNW